ncbi:ABC transporter substrate-binding protein [Solwaraspora sp. WMMA2080]|uniref:ABC transporter substrate-binding protein n=1 Tax=unclassified Solwaraspora TaxID=2627926 RepID=UPI00248C049A|nr:MULTISPECIES: ABC transporter substrate-binding protein [unclassified Solwaraspora]WBB97079.1 ABC transporter substrate-binding protein [Solwaraspora sp. WMMA2059]WBC19019.1 ABC transporter substrate-binding protein [Solwaraspora sp. WMMA2080]
MLVSRGSRTAALAFCAILLVGAAGCAEPAATEESQVNSVRLYGTDGNMSNSFRDGFEGQTALLSGMKGTSPLTPLSDDFISRLRTVDRQLTDFLYAGEAYDAVVISALATQLAGSTDPTDIAAQINGVTTGGEQCDVVAVCLELARDGTDIAYRGVSLKRGGFTDVGEPSTASYATLHFDGDGQINDGKTEFVGAGDESTTTTAAPPPAEPETFATRAEAPLKLGGLLPRTGDLALAYPPLAAGAALAVREINESGGVLGEPVEWFDGDDGTNPDVARRTVAGHVDEGVHVIIGAGASGVSREVLPDVAAAGLILFSPSNTDAGLSEVDDQGLYFRTAPSDLLQGRALADVILRDGSQRIALVARKDSYGEGLQENVRAELDRAGVGPDRLKLLSYEPPAGADAPPVNFDSEAQEIKAFGADAVLIIGFAESAEVIKSLAAAGLPIAE